MKENLPCYYILYKKTIQCFYACVVCTLVFLYHFIFIYKCTILFIAKLLSDSASHDYWIFLPNSCTPSIFHTTDLFWNLFFWGGGGHWNGRKLNLFINNKRQITVLNTSLPVLLNNATLTLLSIACIEFLLSAQVAKGIQNFSCVGYLFLYLKNIYLYVHFQKSLFSLCWMIYNNVPSGEVNINQELTVKWKLK